MKYFLLLLFSFNVYAEFPYDSKAAFNYIAQPGGSFEVNNMSPTKSQDGIGLCYGFSSTSLLENYRCRELKLNCLDPAQHLSPLDVSSYFLNRDPRSIQEAGNANTLLNNFRHSRKKLASENCAKYSSLVYKASKEFKASEGQGWKLLVDSWNQFKNKNIFQKAQQVSCVVGSLKLQITGLQTPADQIEDAFLTATSLENFLFKAIMPTQCLEEDKLVSIPDFAINSYPAFQEKYNEETLANKIESVLLNNIPLEMMICTEEAAKNSCPQGKGHSIVLQGIRESCSAITEDCRTMVRVKNSYGWGWQRDNNDGWVDLQTLTKASMVISSFNNITWLQKPGSILENKKLNRVGASKQATPPKQTESNVKRRSVRPEKYKGFEGLWKCPNDTYQDYYEENCVPGIKF